MPHSLELSLRCSLWIGVVAVLLSSGGCGDPETDAEPDDPPVLVAPEAPAETTLTVSELRRKLKANSNAKFQKIGGEIRFANLFQSGVTDIAPLAGVPLRYLDLTGCSVDDLSPLEGMPLEELYLENTMVTDLSPLKGIKLRILRMELCAVSDISPLEGMPLEQLNLNGTHVTEIAAVKAMPLKTLWLTDTKAADLSPLKGKRLESLDVQGTPVSDLGVLKGMTSLKRLNIAGSQVTDFTPLAGLSLDRLIFTPKKKCKGLDAVREMRSLYVRARGKGIGKEFGREKHAEDFWKEFDSEQHSEHGPLPPPSAPRDDGNRPEK